MKYLNLPYFLAALFIGIIVVCSTSPTPDIIIKYPTPDNANSVTYKDKAEVCYKYKSNSVQCPSNDRISKIPQQQITDANIKNNESPLNKFREIFD
jgi:hypothetical protein